MNNSTITIDDIEKVMRGMPKNPITYPAMFAGLKVFEEPLPPQKIKLSTEIQVTDEFRLEFDTWLLNTFGRQDSLLRDKCFIMETMGMLVVPHGYAGVLANIIV